MQVDGAGDFGGDFAREGVPIVNGCYDTDKIDRGQYYGIAIGIDRPRYVKTCAKRVGVRFVVGITIF